MSIQERAPEQGRNADLVLEGGGVKGIGLLGAVLELADAGYTFPRVAGTSAGAIVAALVTGYQRAGRDLHELEDVLRRVDYKRFAGGPWLQRVTGRFGDAAALLLRNGAHSGGYLADFLGPELERVGVTTFADLAIDDAGGSLAPHQRYSLVVHASDLSRRVLVRLPWDYEQYGMVADEQRVVDAVRASMSIPFYFRPVHVPTESGVATWVDGGLLSNFPITVFDRTDGTRPRWPTWGVKLSGEPAEIDDREINGAVGLAVTCLKTLTSDWNRYRLTAEGVNQRTIHVSTDGVAATDFGIDEPTQRRLFESGREAGRRFLAAQPVAPAAELPQLPRQRTAPSAKTRS
jgi:NTE family protein